MRSLMSLFCLLYESPDPSPISLSKHHPLFLPTLFYSNPLSFSPLVIILLLSFCS